MILCANAAYKVDLTQLCTLTESTTHLSVLPFVPRTYVFVSRSYLCSGEALPTLGIFGPHHRIPADCLVWLVTQAQATTIGLHQLLLNCVADTHALLALKAFQPSHQQTSAAIVPTPHSDFMQAKAAGKLPSHGKGARFRQKGTKELHRGKADGVTAEAPSKALQPGNGELQPCLRLLWCPVMCCSLKPSPRSVSAQVCWAVLLASLSRSKPEK